MSITIQGVQQLNQDFRRLLALTTTTEARRALREGARIIATEQRRRAPVGLARDGSTNPGQLRRSIVYFLGRKKQTASWVRVNILSGRNAARHGHLVSFGTRPRTWGGKLMRFRFRGKWRSARQVKGMAPNPYFEQGFNAAVSAAANHIVAALKAKAEGK